jgi:hypothetical protein
MILIVDSSQTPNPGITIYNYRENALLNGETSLWMSNGLTIRKECLPALKKFIDLENYADEEIAYDNPVLPKKYLILVWHDDEDGEGEGIIDEIKAYTEAHANLVLRNGINSGKYPKGAWVQMKKERVTV